MKNFIKILLLAIVFSSCSSDNEWKNLLAEDSLIGWHYYNDNGNKTGWSVSDGILSFDPTVSNYQTDEDGNILTWDNGGLKKENNDLVSDLDYNLSLIHISEPTTSPRDLSTSRMPSSA